MLREIHNVRQDHPGLMRRWYQDDFFDLYTWQTADLTLILDKMREYSRAMARGILPRPISRIKRRPEDPTA